MPAGDRAPTVEDVLSIIEDVNADFGFYREEALPELARILAGEWGSAFSSWHVRKKHPQFHFEALHEEERERLVREYDEFYARTVRIWNRNWMRFHLLEALADPRMGPAWPVRLISDLSHLSCAAARGRHGEIMPLARFLVDFPLPACTKIDCGCHTRADPFGYTTRPLK